MPESRTDRGRAAGRDQVSEVFLSPRVVDQGAFTEYSASLRRLIEQAGGQADALRAAAQDADVARNALKELAGKHQAKFDLAAKVLAGLDQRAAEAERLLSAARDAVASLDALKSEADRVVADHVARLEARLEGVFGDVQGRLARLEADARQHSDDAKRSLDDVVVGAAERMNAQVRQIHEQTLAEHERIIAGADARVADATVALEKMVRRTQSEHERVIAGTDARVTDAAAALAESLQRAMGQIDSRTQAAVLAVEAGQQESAAKATALVAAIETNLNDGDRRLREQQQTVNLLEARLMDLIAEAETVIGWTGPQTLADPTDPGDERTPVPGSLTDVLSQTRAAREQAQALLVQVRSLAQQGDQARSMLGASIVEATEKIDRLNDRAATVGEAVGRALDSATHAETRLRTQRDQIEAALAAPIDALEARGRTLRQQLETLVHQAETSRDATERVMGDTWSLVQGLEKQLIELRPWKPLLLEGQEGALPAPVAKLVDAMRSEMARDLGVIAAGMYQIALKAQRLGESVASESTIQR